MSAPHTTAKAATTQFPPLPAKQSVGDESDQHMISGAQRGHRVVAVGRGTKAGVSVPLFWYSDDNGRSWRDGVIAGARSSGDAQLVIAGPSGFTAFGNRLGGGVWVWRSSDGGRWSSVSQLDFPVDASSVTATVPLGHGYLAIGNMTQAGRDVPASWTSRDGRSWNRRAGTRFGLRDGRLADLHLASVAVAPGGVAVAAGSQPVSGPGTDDRAVLLVSRNRGRTWSRLTTGPLLRTESWNSLDRVRWESGRFLALGTEWSSVSQDYRPVLLSSRDGRTWRRDNTVGRTPQEGNAEVSDIAASGRTLVLTESTRSDAGVVPRVLIRVHGSWRAGQVAEGGRPFGTTPWVASALATSSGDVLMFGSRDPNGDDDAQIWRASAAKPGAFTPSVVPASAHPVGEGTDSQVAIAAGRGKVLAVGESGGVPVVWTSTDGRTFGVPVRLSHDPLLSADTVRASSLGWIITGSAPRGDNSGGVAWTSPDGVHWTQSEDQAFGPVDRYASNSLAAAAAFQGRWVVVGSAQNNGDESRHALTAVQETHGLFVSTEAGADHADATAADGSDGAKRAMADVVPVSHTLVAAGYAYASVRSNRFQPAVWSSTDAWQWTIRLLPAGPGNASGAVSRLSVHGRTVVGFGRVEVGQNDRPYVWVSGDGGRSWHVHALPASAGNVDPQALVWTGSAFVALGAIEDAKAWRSFVEAWKSADGSSWQRVRLTDSRINHGGLWTVSGATVVRGAPLALLKHVEPIAGTVEQLTVSLQP